MDDSKPLIHLVDPDSEHLVYLFDFLSLEGFPVAASSSAREALRYVARMRPRVVLAAWEMPGWSGLELLEEVTRISPETHLVFMVRPGDPLPKPEDLATRSLDLLVKPCKPRALITAIDKIMEGVK